MTTYEHGKHPDGAPVTWHIDYMGQWIVVTHHEFIVDGKPHTETLGHHRRALGIMGCERFAEHRCRAFHLAKLAEEAAGVIAGAHATTVGAIDWLRRYRAAKGEA